MFRHIVLVRWKESASSEDRELMRATIEGLPALVPEILSANVGLNVGSGPNHYDFATVFDFESQEAFKRYISSEAHQEYVKGPGQTVEQLAVVQHFF